MSEKSLKLFVAWRFGSPCCNSQLGTVSHSDVLTWSHGVQYVS